MSRPQLLRLAALGGLLALALAGAAQAGAAPAPRVLLVGTYHGIQGSFRTIDAAVSAARPGDWILVGPGDYKEKGVSTPEPAGVLITTPGLHLRGMDRNGVIVDGTKPGAAPCSRAASDQGPLGRNGVEVFGTSHNADGVYIENLTVCNFLTGPSGGEGNQIWWNGGDGSGHLGMSGFWGNYLTATSTYSNWVNYPAGDYGIFVSNASDGSFNHSYASNMADSDFYVGACQQQCNTVLNQDHGQYGSLCLSSTNAGGYLLVEHMECDLNKTGLVSNSQNNDDWPSPQNGACPAGSTGPLPAQTASCTVWAYNYIHDNNNPNVPGNGSSGLAGAGPVGTGLIFAGTTYSTMYGNVVERNGAWGELIADLPDQEPAPPQDPVQCQGGIWTGDATGICYYPAYGNQSLSNQFSGNGFFGNPTNGDVGLATNAHADPTSGQVGPGNCFNGDQDPGGLTTDPPGIEQNPLYQPSGGRCTTPNSGDYTALAAEAACAAQLLGPCPSLPGATYPRPDPSFTLSMPDPGLTPSMPDPCAGVPANRWCP